MADGVGFDFRQLVFAIAERAQSFRHGLVDDLEVAAARQLFEFDECEIWFDAGRVAVHHQADGAGGRDNGCLRVAEAVLFANGERAIPGAGCGVDQAFVFARRVVERHGDDGQRFIAGLLPVRGAAVIADDAQHVVRVWLVARERSKLGRHFAAGRIRDAGHDGRDGAADGTALRRVIRRASRHQHAADVGKT